jgi:hypothetical protein
MEEEVKPICIVKRKTVIPESSLSPEKNVIRFEQHDCLIKNQNNDCEDYIGKPEQRHFGQGVGSIPFIYKELVLIWKSIDDWHMKQERYKIKQAMHRAFSFEFNHQDYDTEKLIIPFGHKIWVDPITGEPTVIRDLSSRGRIR